MKLFKKKESLDEDIERIFATFDLIVQLLSETVENLKKAHANQLTTLKNLKSIETTQERSGKIIRNIASDLKVRDSTVLDAGDLELL